jgi:hypothetical protein
MTSSGEWTRVTHLSIETGFDVAITTGHFLHQLITLHETLSILALRAISWQSDDGTIASFSSRRICPLKGDCYGHPQASDRWVDPREKTLATMANNVARLSMSAKLRVML